MFRVVKKIKRYIQIHSHYTKTVNELSRLSNRDLADLGIARSDIEYIARRASLRKNRQLS